MNPTADPQASSQQKGPHWVGILIGTPFLLLGGFVTAILGIILCSYLVTRIGGGRPEPGLFRLLIIWLLFGLAPIAAATALLRATPPTQRFSWKLLLGMFLLFLVVGADANFGPHNWHRLFRGETSAPTEAASLKRTFVSAYTDVPISAGTNVLWCGTFQLAWNEVCKMIGNDLQLGKEVPMVSALNKHAFTKASLDESSYVAMAGLVKDDICEKIRKAVEAKFHGAFKPRFLPDQKGARTQLDLIAYACLYKNLTFPTPFERLDADLAFSGTLVPAFGFSAKKPSQPETYAQVLILDYQSDADFVIELKTKSTGDRLILAKLPPRPTLDETIAHVSVRASTNNLLVATTNDVLAVPRMKFDITREYSEIKGLRLAYKGLPTEAYISSAVQNTRFEMNEKGVELRSEAHVAIACAAQEIPVSKHKLLFDKPFLIMMERTNAKMPYFALWVDNPEILVSWK